MSLIIAGHRGVAGRYPENTRVSVQAAIDLGLNWVEVDVQPTKDGVLVVCHDHTVDRCSNGRGRVDEYTLAELSQLDFGGWFDPRFSAEPIMTLAQLLSLAGEHGLKLNIEVKVDQHDAAQVVQLLRTELAKGGLVADQLLLSSFSHDVLLQLHQHCLGYRLGVLSEELTAQDWQMLKQINAFSCHLDYHRVNALAIRELKQQGYQVWCYTVNEPESFAHIDEVDAIFSDFPERFMA